MTFLELLAIYFIAMAHGFFLARLGSRKRLQQFLKDWLDVKL